MPIDDKNALKAENARNVGQLAESLPPERQQVLSLLSEKKWFKKTDFELQKRLLDLPADFDGFLADLATRKEEFGGMDVVKLLDIQRGNYNIVPLFKVRSHQTNQVFTYEYTSSKYGRNPGYRGIIFFEVRGVLKYFVLRRTEKFAIGASIFETIGGYIQFRDNKLLNMPKSVEETIKKELGIKEFVVKRFIDLGLVAVDPAVTNNTTSLYAAVIDVSHAPNLERLEKKTFHTKPVEFELVIEPIDRLREYVQKVDESFFLACVIRLVSLGFVSL
jgi:hypothetical protein